MAKQSPSLYSVSKTFVWFAVVSVLLTGSLFAIVLLDHRREWKGHQKKFNELKLQKAREELKAAGAAVDPAKLTQLKAGLDKARGVLASQKKLIGGLEKEQASLDTKIAKVKAEYQSLKQYEDSYKYYVEEHRQHHDPKAAQAQKDLEKTSPKVKKLRLELEVLEKTKEETEKKIAGLFEERKNAQTQIDGLLEEQSRAQKRIDVLKPSLVKDVLNAPMVDFIAPSLQVRQIVLENLEDDYHFTKVQKVDRCTTCHLGIDQKGFEDAPQPFRTHPRPDLYLATDSAHPLESFGCTSCHGGSGQAVSFVETAHTPRDEKQAAEWEKKHHWHRFKHWGEPMLPMPYVQAACAKCHAGTVEAPKADKLNQGRRLAQVYGCFNCHKVKGFEDYWKVGPDLTHVKGKIDETWVTKWLEDPKGFRPSTKMPAIFHLSNTSSPEDKAKSDAAIRAIAAYLLKNSEPANTGAAPAPGDLANGEKLVKTVGCLGCHSAAGIEAGNYAPELSGLGSKVSPEWLYAWLKDPKHVSPGTRMPNLRLTDAEAADITAYLLSLRNDPFEQKEAPAADPKVVDGLILESLQGTMRASEAEEALAKMNGEERLEFLGKKSITHQGCYSCHAIKGFEDAKPIGAELSDEGRKDVNKFFFGFTGIPETRHDWIRQKLKDPRSFDHGKIAAYYEKLRMPQFGFTDEEVEALTTFVLSLTEEQIPLASRKVLDEKGRRIERGRFLAAKLNCQGCHTLDGKEGLLRRIAEDKGAAPPVLDGEGAKVQEKWLHEFLKEPQTIRPWLTYRMPTFGLSEEELDDFVYYFHHLAGQEVSFAPGGIPPSEAHTLAAGKQLFDAFQCVKCHQVTPETAAMGASFLAPDLTLTKRRLKPEWNLQWLRDPQTLQEGTMMPTFFADGQSPMPDVLEGDAEKQITAIRDYLYRYGDSEV